MSLVRVFVPTFGRPQLLRRALASLCAQTLAEWVAEVHNDLPGDPTPAQIVAEVADPRITLVEHRENLGGTATFNLFFRPSSEPYYSILEDDNWWEPEFLERMLGHLDAHTNAVVAWCNQHVAEEQQDGSWVTTNRTVRPLEQNAEARLVEWPQIEQLYGAVHSNGAMLVRSRSDDDFRTPLVEFAGVEGFRERCFPFPLLYVPESLAWFSVTRQTHRNRNRTTWATVQALLSASLLCNASSDKLDPELVWLRARLARLPTTSLLILACLSHRALRCQLRFATCKDWLRLVAASLLHPTGTWAALRAHRVHHDWWEFLNRHTAARFAE